MFNTVRNLPVAGGIAPRFRPVRRPLPRALAQVLPGAMLLSAGLLLTPVATATTFQVTNTNDVGAGSLRDAIDQANANPGADVITFASSVTGSVSLASGSLYITDSVAIQGPGAGSLALDASSASYTGPFGGVVTIMPPAGPLEVSLSGLTLTGGTSYYTGGAIAAWDTHLEVHDCIISGNEAGFAGGGIWLYSAYEASLDLVDSTVSGNTAAAAGGGVYAGADAFGYGYGVADTSMTISRSVISGNTAPGDGGTYPGLGGGIYALNIESSTIDGSTIENNASGQSGGGITAIQYLQRATIAADQGLQATKAAADLIIAASTVAGNATGDSGGGIASVDVDLELRNSTIVGNQTLNGSGSTGGGIAVLQTHAGALTLASTTVANNQAANGTGGGLAITSSSATAAPTVDITDSVLAGNSANSEADLATIQRSAGLLPAVTMAYSLVQVPGSVTITDNGGNIFNQAAGLGALAENGGPTWTMLPQPGSPLIDAGNPAYAGAATDQRGSGFPRVANGRIDIGAVEAAAQLAPLPTTVAVPSLSSGGKLGLGALLGLLALTFSRQRARRHERRPS